jgi:hypothetical protein
MSFGDIDRVARAIRDRDHNKVFSDAEWQNCAGREVYMSLARAAILAMREPSPEMVEAVMYGNDDEYDPDISDEDACRKTWTAMIDEMLKE